jgi:hypothetical protein
MNSIANKKVNSIFFRVCKTFTLCAAHLGRNVPGGNGGCNA